MKNICTLLAVEWCMKKQQELTLTHNVSLLQRIIKLTSLAAESLIHVLFR